MIQLYKLIKHSLKEPRAPGTATLTSLERWYSRIGCELELSESLSLELESGYPRVRLHNELERALESYNEPHQGSAPFYFALRGATCIEDRKVGTINSLLRVCPHAGIALLVILTDEDLIGSEYINEVRVRQRCRIAERDRKEFAFMLNVTVIDPGQRERLTKVVLNFLQSDDEHIATTAMTTEFPEFDDIEIVNRTRF